jgi:hypothetical protein
VGGGSEVDNWQVSLTQAPAHSTSATSDCICDAIYSPSPKAMNCTNMSWTPHRGILSGIRERDRILQEATERDQSTVTNKEVINPWSRIRITPSPLLPRFFGKAILRSREQGTPNTPTMVGQNIASKHAEYLTSDYGMTSTFAFQSLGFWCSMLEMVLSASSVGDSRATDGRKQARVFLMQNRGRITRWAATLNRVNGPPLS